MSTLKSAMPSLAWKLLLCVVAASAPGFAGAATVTAVTTPSTFVVNGGFEAPNLPANSFTYSAANTGWNELLGIVTNNGGWGNPNAPEGDQALFMQGWPTYTQTLTLPGGRYRVTLKAAQRSSNIHPQTISVRIDGTEIGTFAPAGTAYSAYSTPSLLLAGGTHTLGLVGLNLQGGDNTAFVDDVQIVADNLLADGGFETPNLTAANTYVYAPQNATWQFPQTVPSSNTTGVAANGTGGFGAGVAPEGDQVLFVQGGTPVSSLAVAQQTFQAAAGQYRLTLKAARRGTQNQTVSVNLDGMEIGRINPQSGTYVQYVFDGLWIDAGPRVLSIVGVNPNGGDNTAFVDDVQLLPLGATSRLWSQDSTWVGGVKPVNGDEVIIPSGARVIYDVASLAPRTLTVAGEFHCAETDTALSAEWIMVHGRFACGSPFSPLAHQFTVTLRGLKDSDDIMGMGDKFFGAMSGAVVELHGATRTTWTRLASTVNAGATILTMVEPINWKIGEQVVIAPTRESTAEGEVRTISATKSLLNQITVSTPLTYAHFAGQSEYTNDTNTWRLDESAEVGLLSRKIKFQGEIAGTDADNIAYGGHMMTMAGSVIHASGIELFQMGQRKLLGRYPFHWHLVGDAPGQYITDSSIHHSFNRCVTVHGTNQVRVADNVCYDFIGHGYFLEDGYERYNVFHHNLGILARKADPAFAVPMPTQPGLPNDTDYREGPSNASTGPAVFWISNPTNTYTDNAAAGSEGTGYWYHLLDVVVGASAGLPGAGAIVPRTAQFGLFDNNRAHSSRQGFSSCREAGGLAGMDSLNVVITRLHVSHAKQGIWPCANDTRRENAVFEQAIVANSPNGMQAPSPMRFKDSVFAGYSDNPTPNPFPYVSVGSIGVSVYDQGFIFDNVHFVNYDRPGHSVFFPAGGAHKLTSNRIDRVTFENAPNVFFRYAQSYVNTFPALWGEPIHFFDARPFGITGAVVPPNPIMADATCAVQLTPTFPGYLCPYRYIQFRMDGAFLGNVPVVTVLRSDGVHETGGHIDSRFIAATIAGGPYSYSYRFDAGVTNRYLAIGVEAAFPGDSPVIQLLDVPGTAAPYTTVPGWTKITTNVQDLRNLPGRGYFVDSNSGSLYVKPVAAGSQWYAWDNLGICMAGAGCSAGPRTVVPPPAVTVTSPLDGARVTANLPVTFNVNVVPATGVQSVRVFVGDDQKGMATGTVSPYAITTTTGFAPGRYAVKVVVRYGTNDTYTAVQQLIVGEPEDRLTIATPANGGTYTPASIPNLSVNTIGWTPAFGGKHLHWFDNGVYQGDITSSSQTVSLAGLTQGMHEIRVTQADAGHVPRAIDARIVVHMARDGVLADFEDGVDPRGTLTTHNVANPVGTIAYHPDAPPVSRINNVDDINYFDILPYPNDGVTTTATYRLNLAPGMNWSGYGRIELYHWGTEVELFAIYANAGAKPLGKHDYTAGPMVTQTSFTPLAGDTVIALELRHSEAASTVFYRQHLYYIKLLPP